MWATYKDNVGFISERNFTITPQQTTTTTTPRITKITAITGGNTILKKRIENKGIVFKNKITEKHICKR